MEGWADGASTLRDFLQPLIHLLFNNFGDGVGGSWIHEASGKSKEKRMRNKIVFVFENHITVKKTAK